MKLLRPLAFLVVLFAASMSSAEEQIFRGVVDTVNDPDVFGTDIQIGDSVTMVLTLDTDAPSSTQDISAFFNGISGVITRHTWPSFAGFAPGGTIQVDVGERSFDCNFSDFADAIVADDFQSATVETLLEPTDIFIARGTDGVSVLGSPPADCVDLRIGPALASQSTDPLADGSLQLPEDCAVWGSQRWTIDVANFNTTTLMLTWDTIIAGDIESIGPSPESLLADLIEGVDEASLPRGIHNSLQTLLENALAKLQSGKLSAAKGMLSAAIKQIRALSGKKIDTADAQAGIAEIQAIIGLLGSAC